MLGPQRLQVLRVSVNMFNRHWVVDARITDTTELVDASAADLVKHVRLPVTKAFHCAVWKHSSQPVYEVPHGIHAKPAMHRGDLSGRIVVCCVAINRALRGLCVNDGSRGAAGALPLLASGRVGARLLAG